jgi:hypothetical protein
MVGQGPEGGVRRLDIPELLADQVAGDRDHHSHRDGERGQNARLEPQQRNGEHEEDRVVGQDHLDSGARVPQGQAENADGKRTNQDRRGQVRPAALSTAP